jgi:hypothetical protein
MERIGRREGNMRIYYVTGSAVPKEHSLTAPAEAFGMNICAANKRDAYHYAAEDMDLRGYTGIVVAHAEDIASGNGWTPGQASRIN